MMYRIETKGGVSLFTAMYVGTIEQVKEYLSSHNFLDTPSLTISVVDANNLTKSSVEHNKDFAANIGAEEDDLLEFL